MYDDNGDKFPVSNPYEVKKLIATTLVQDKIKHNEQKKEQKKKRFQDVIDNNVANAYKQIANIHIEEKVFHAYQLMHHDVITINEHDSIYECWVKMLKYDVKQIPIVGINDKIKGLATMKNITKTLIEHIKNPNFIYNTSINTIAIKEVMTAEPIADIRRIAKVMVKYHLNSIPIVDSSNDEVVGILSRADILRAVSTNPHFQLWA
jgi:CBS domain-containing protein